MRRRLRLPLLPACGILLLRAVLFAPAFAAEVPAKPEHRETDRAFVLGGTPARNRAVTGLVNTLDEALDDAGLPPSLQRGRKIVITLRPVAETPAPVLVFRDAVTFLDLPDTLVETATSETLRQLVLAHATQLTAVNARPTKPAPWLVESLLAETTAAGKPARIDALARRTIIEGPGELDALDRADAPNTELRAFWFGRVIRRELPDADKRARLYAAALTGAKVSELQSQLFPHAVDTHTRTVAWPLAFYRAASERAERANDAPESETRLAEITRFVAGDESGEKDAPLTTRDLIARRADPVLAEAVAERLLRLKIELPRANPLWHNAYAARGLFLEKLRAPGITDAELAKLASDADAEAAFARALAREARDALAQTR